MGFARRSSHQRELSHDLESLMLLANTQPNTILVCKFHHRSLKLLLKDLSIQAPSFSYELLPASPGCGHPYRRWDGGVVGWLGSEVL